MTPSEFQYRANSAAEELMARNPAYTDEITAQMSSVYKRGGLNSLLKSDMAFYGSTTKKHKQHKLLKMD